MSQSPRSAPAPAAGAEGAPRARPFTRADLVARFGRVLFAGAIAVFGVQHFIFGDFIPGRAPAWPAGWPGQVVFAWLTGVVFLACGLVLLVDEGERRRLIVAALAGVLVAGWAVLRGLPHAVADVPLGGQWTQLGKGVVIGAGLGVLACDGRPQSVGRAVLCGRVALGAFMILAGLQHFRWADFAVAFVPAWVPGGGLFWVFATGVFLIAGGAGLMIPRLAERAGMWSGLMIFLWVPMVHVPSALAARGTATSQNEWTAVVEATAFAGLAWWLTGRGRFSADTFATLDPGRVPREG